MPEKTEGFSIESVGEVSPHNKAMYEAGKKLLIDSIDVGREFCKFMITTTISAVPIYIGLLKLIVPEKHVLASDYEVLFFLTPLLFLISSIVFIVGYMPQKSSISLELVEEIRKARNVTISFRRRISILGFIVFLVGLSLGSFLIIKTILDGTYLTV